MHVPLVATTPGQLDQICTKRDNAGNLEAIASYPSIVQPF